MFHTLPLQHEITQALAAKARSPRITVQTRYEDGTVQHERSFEGVDLIALLNSLVVNWTPAQGGRVPHSDRFYLNPRLMVSINGAAFVPVNDAVRSYETARVWSAAA